MNLVFALRAATLGLCLSVACSEARTSDPGPGPRPVPLEPAAQDEVGPVPASPLLVPLPPGDDPTAPTALTGVRQTLSLAYQQDLSALLAHTRSTLLPLSCPGLFESASCGDGTCDGTMENRENCPADCVYHAIGAYNDLPICTQYQQVVTPRSVHEVQDAVLQALSAGQRVRPIGARHSASDVLCGDGVALDMSELADVRATRIVGDVAYVLPGVRMIDLGDHLQTKGLSIGFTHLGFRGVTVAGAIGTSAHGSSPTFNNALSQRVTSLKMVLADGSLRTFDEASTQPVLWRALITSLGLLGVVVEVGVRIEPAFNLDVEVKQLDEDALLAAGSPLALIAGCDWGQLNWFPHHRKVFRWCGKKTGAPAQEGANNVLLDPGVGADLAKLGKLAFHAGTCASALNELVEGARVDGLTDKPPIVIKGADGALEHTTHAVGPAHRMTSADLIELGGNKYFQMDWEVAVPQQYMADALAAARKMFDAHNVSLPGVGVFVRFGKVERGGWLSYHSAGKEFAEGETAMFFETPVAVPVGYSEVQLTDYLHIYRELIGLFVRHFGARAHWGKNLDSVFALQRSVGTYEGRIDKVNEAVAELDPYGVFANDFARRIGVTWPKQGQDFTLALGHGACSCGTEGPALGACSFRDMNVFASPCRAACAGRGASDLLPGACSALLREPCSAFETTTCVYDRKAREQNPFVEPLVRF